MSSALTDLQASSINSLKRARAMAGSLLDAFGPASFDMALARFRAYADQHDEDLAALWRHIAELISEMETSHALSARLRGTV